MTAHLGDLVSALVDGQLEPAEEASALSHLAGCERCAAELKATADMRAVVRGLGQVDPPRPLAAPVAGPRGLLAGIAAAAAAVAVLVLSGLEPDSGTRPEVARLVQVHSTSPVNSDPMSQLAPAAIPVSLGR